jgi:iodotyrosine deiodinase
VIPPDFVPLPPPPEFTETEMVARARAFNEELQRRRTIRHFSSRPVPRAVLEQALLAAGSAPSGAHRQPWRFVVITDPSLKRAVRQQAEESERHFYAHAPAQWLEALKPLGTDEHKPYLETAPCLIAVFAERYGQLGQGRRSHNYYVLESVGIATGFLIAALHHAGLSTLTHTPSPMAFLGRILGRPENERPFLLLVVGFPAEGAMVPRLTRKTLDETTVWR